MLLQSFLLSVVLFQWIDHPVKQKLDWTLDIAFCPVMMLYLLGLLTRRFGAT